MRPETTLTEQRSILVPNMDIPTTPRDPFSKAKAKALNENKEKLRSNVDYSALFDVQDG